jgi:subtilase family serine protease
VDLDGQWLSLTRSLKKSFNMVTGKIRVKNLGNQVAPSSVLYVYQALDSLAQDTYSLLGKINVSSISAGGYLDVNLNFKAPYDRRGVYLIGVLDAANAILETDETNNKVVSGLMQ